VLTPPGLKELPTSGETVGKMEIRLMVRTQGELSFDRPCSHLVALHGCVPLDHYGSSPNEQEVLASSPPVCRDFGP